MRACARFLAGFQPCARAAGGQLQALLRGWDRRAHGLLSGGSVHSVGGRIHGQF